MSFDESSTMGGEVCIAQMTVAQMQERFNDAFLQLQRAVPWLAEIFDTVTDELADRFLDGPACAMSTGDQIRALHATIRGQELEKDKYREDVLRLEAEVKRLKERGRR